MVSNGHSVLVPLLTSAASLLFLGGLLGCSRGDQDRKIEDVVSCKIIHGGKRAVLSGKASREFYGLLVGITKLAQEGTLRSWRAGSEGGARTPGLFVFEFKNHETATPNDAPTESYKYHFPGSRKSITTPDGRKIILNQEEFDRIEGFLKSDRVTWSGG
jgi:hypothetical protein